MVSSFAPPHGGASVVAYGQARYLKQVYDHQITMLSFESGFDDLVEYGCRVVKFKGIQVRQDWLLRFKEYIDIYKLCGQQDVILLHSQYYFINLIAAFFGRLKTKKVVCLYHGHLASKWRNSLNTKIINFLIDRWLILNKESASFLEDYCKPKDTQLVKNGIEGDLLIKEFVSTNKVCRKFAFCGSLYADKGMRELLIAIDFFREAEFNIIGDGEYSEIFKNKENVNLYGYLERKKALEIIRKSDCLILPSYHEVFPMVIVESLAMGVPVIVTDLNKGIHELVDGNGILIRANDQQALNEAIKFAIGHGLMIKEYKKVQNLSWEKVIRLLNKGLKF
jgi:glycosyltransferase involved in cell wall biosynthesis